MGKAKTVNDSDHEVSDESNEEDINSDYELSESDTGEDANSDHQVSDEDNEEDGTTLKPRKKAKEHMGQLQRLPEKDPEFYQFLKEHAKELLDFNDDGIDEDADTDMEEPDLQDDDGTEDKVEKPPQKVLTTAMVDSWCDSIREDGRLGAVRSLMRAFRTACHYGDDSGDDSGTKFSVMSSSVFNKIMLFVLNEMDGILRKLFKLPASGGKKETIKELMTTKQWASYNHLVKSYLGNALHVLNQMTDTEMISFTIRRLKYSSIFLAALPSLLRKYIKVVLHFWGTGGGALPVVSFLFLRDICIRLGSDCIDECFKGIYKAYVLNCQFVNAVKLQHIQFLGNCVIELLGVDLPTAYQHAFVFIRQLGMILREAITMKTKESFRKVYEWKFMNCLELWTGAICAYGSEPDFRPLAYPLAQIITGVARLVPTARYFPLRLRCVRMLNRIAAATDTFLPVSMLLLDMLEMKELNIPPTGGVGKAVDLRTVLKVNKATLKTRGFQEACVFSVVEEVAEHLAQWSYSVAFFELSFIPAVRLRNFCKATKVDRFRKEMRSLVRQIEANSKFTNAKRMSISFLPNDPAAASFLEDEKKEGVSPLSQHVAILRQRVQQRTDSLMESSVTVGEHSSIFGRRKKAESDDDEEEDDDNSRDDQGDAIFSSSSWLPGGTASASNAKQSEEGEKKTKKKQKKVEEQEREAVDEDIVEDLVLSSDDEDGAASAGEEEDEVAATPPSKERKRKPDSNPRKSKKRRGKPRPYNHPKKRKTAK